MIITVIVFYGAVAAKIFYCIDSSAHSSSSNLFTSSKNSLMKIILQDAINELTEAAYKNTIYESEYNSMMGTVYDNLFRPEIVKIHMKKFISVVLSAYNISPAEINIAKHNAYIYELLQLIMVEKELNKSKFEDLKAFHEYKKSEYFFAFFNLIIEDIIHQEMCKAWMKNDCFDIEYLPEIINALKDKVYNFDIHSQIVQSFDEKNILKYDFNMFHVITDRASANSFIEFFNKKITSDDYLFYVVNEFNTIFKFCEWCGFKLRQSNRAKNTVSDAFSKAKKKLKNCRDDFIAYGDKLAVKRMIRFALILDRKPWFFYYRTNLILYKGFKDIERFQRFCKNINKIHGLIYSFMKIIYKW